MLLMVGVFVETRIYLEVVPFSLFALVLLLTDRRGQ